MTNTVDTAEGKILQAARAVFIRAGFNGARMQDIADEAGINKALLHYYFRSKDKLFDLVFTEQLAQFMLGINTVLATDASLADKIRQIVHFDITANSQLPNGPSFVLHELSQRPDLLVNALAGERVQTLFSSFDNQVRDAVLSGQIRAVRAEQLLINLISLTIFPFVARPLLQGLTQLTTTAYDDLMEQRKEEVADFILLSLRP